MAFRDFYEEFGSFQSLLEELQGMINFLFVQGIRQGLNVLLPEEVIAGSEDDINDKDYDLKYVIDFFNSATAIKLERELLDEGFDFEDDV